MLQKAWELPSEKVLIGLWACIKCQIKYQGARLDELRAFCVCRAQSYFFICIYIHIHILPLASELTFKQQQIKSGCTTSPPLLLLNVDSCITAGNSKHSRAHTASGSWAFDYLGPSFPPRCCYKGSSNFFFKSYQQAGKKQVLCATWFMQGGK